MPDVSNVVLVLNTAVAGGLALAGSWLASRTQRVVRSDEARRADAELMRNKTAELFVDINVMSDELIELEIEIRTGGYNRGMAVPAVSDLRSRVAIYFPDQLGLLDGRKHRATIEAKHPVPPIPSMDDENWEKLWDAHRAGELLVNAKILSHSLGDLERALIKEVRRYVPRGG